MFMVCFAEKIRKLSEEVFGLSDAHQRIHVFWEDAERIAFNQKGKLFLMQDTRKVLGT